MVALPSSSEGQSDDAYVAGNLRFLLPVGAPSGRIQRHRQYEEYILNDVLPFMGLKNPHPCVIVHGCSLGAYHAVNIAMRHPLLFRKLAAFSGRYDLTINVEGSPDLFEGYYNEDVYFQTPTHFLPNHVRQRLAHLRNMDVVLPSASPTRSARTTNISAGFCMAKACRIARRLCPQASESLR
jgi:esterase/lipase superfamily enzyme